MKYVMMAAVFLLSACDKDYACECRMRGSGNDADSTLHIFRGSLASAENSCVALEKKKRVKEGDSSATCEITNDNK